MFHLVVVTSGSVLVVGGLVGLLLSGYRARIVAGVALCILAWLVGGCLGFFAESIALRIVGLVLFCPALPAVVLFARKLRRPA